MIDYLTYPPTPHVRKHGPEGYLNYESYRGWLRDEFCFRCVYCLAREKWSFSRGGWHIDHFIPQASDGDLTCAYTNLLYTCGDCNSAKNDRASLDPCQASLANHVRFLDDGSVEGIDRDGRIFVKTMCLHLGNTDRARLIKIISALQKNNPALLKEFLGFPDNLPNLERARAPRNSAPEGIRNSFYAQRERGELPETY